MVTRQEAIAAVADFAGPLGPFESFDEQRERLNGWVAAAGPGLTAALLDLLIDPPDASLVRLATDEGVEIALRQLLVRSGRGDPERLLDEIGPHLANDRARPTIIEAIGELGLPQGIAWLRPLVANRDLTEDELVRLAGALGEIGGAEARALLEQMRVACPADLDDVRREIAIALESARDA